MRSIQLGPNGELHAFRAVPPNTVGSRSDQVDVDWPRLLTADMLGFELASLRATTWLMPTEVASDHSQSWEGTWPGSDEPIYLQAAAYQGRIVEVRFFRQDQVAPAKKSAAPRLSDQRLDVLFLFLAFGTAVTLAFRHVNLGVGDTKATTPLSIWFFATNMILWSVSAGHVQHPDEFGLLLIGIQTTAGYTILIMVMYFAFEPLVRRRMPHLLVSWTRLMRLQVKNPIVGRDILVGVCVATLSVAIYDCGRIARIFTPSHYAADSFGGLRETTRFLIMSHGGAIFEALIALFVLLVIFTILRYKWPAILAFAATGAYFDSLELNAVPTAYLLVVVIGLVVALSFWEFGLLFAVAYSTVRGLLDYPLTDDVSRFYFANGLILLIIVAALGVYGYRTSLGSGIRLSV